MLLCYFIACATDKFLNFSSHRNISQHDVRGIPAQMFAYRHVVETDEPWSDFFFVYVDYGFVFLPVRERKRNLSFCDIQEFHLCVAVLTVGFILSLFTAEATFPINLAKFRYFLLASFTPCCFGTNSLAVRIIELNSFLFIMVLYYYVVAV